MYAIRFRGSVADNVVSHLAARRLDRLINFARRNREALGDDLKVVDEGFHLGLHLLAVRQHDLGRVSFNGSFRHSRQRLLHHANRFAQLLDAANVSREHVAFGADRNFELEIFVARVGCIAAKVNVDPAGTQRRTARAQSNGIVRAQAGDALGAHHENRISGQQPFIFIHVPKEAVGELFDFFEESQRRLQRQPANAEIRRHHPLSADHLKESQNIFAFAEAIEKHRHRAQVHGVRSQPDQVRIDPRQLIHQNPHPLRFRRNLQPQQLLHRQAVGEIVGQGAEVVDAVG